MQLSSASLALIFLVCALGICGFHYANGPQISDLGSLHLFVDEERRMNAPVWLGIGALLLSGALLLTVRRI